MKKYLVILVTLIAILLIPGQYVVKAASCFDFRVASCVKDSYICAQEFGQLDCGDNSKCGIDCNPSASSCDAHPGADCYPPIYSGWICEEEYGPLDCGSGYRCAINCSAPPPDPSPSEGLFSNPSGISTIDELLEKIINFVYAMSFPIVTGVVLYAAFIMMTSGGDPKKFQVGINIIIYAAIGFVVILLSKGVVFIIRSIFS
jgi:hypothetical protein